MSGRRRLIRCLRCLFLSLSPLRVALLLLTAFLLHLRREPKQLAQWLDMARIAFQAELLHGAAAAACMGLLAATCSELVPLPGRLAQCGVLLLLATMCPGGPGPFDAGKALGYFGRG